MGRWRGSTRPRRRGGVVLVRRRRRERSIAARSQVPNCFADTTAIDDELSNRWIDLDPAGYFLIAVDKRSLFGS